MMNFCLDIGHYAASKHTKQNKSHLMIKQEVAIKLGYHGRLTALSKDSCVCKRASRRELPAGLLPAGIAGERKKQWKLCCLFFACSPPSPCFLNVAASRSCACWILLEHTHQLATSPCPLESHLRFSGAHWCLDTPAVGSLMMSCLPYAHNTDACGSGATAGSSTHH